MSEPARPIQPDQFQELLTILRQIQYAIEALGPNKKK